MPIDFASPTWLHLQVATFVVYVDLDCQNCITPSVCVAPCVFSPELYTVTVLTEAAMMGTDIDGDVLVYLDMAQVV